MTIDIRASCTCSLGTLISASISDDYIQGSGLIKVRGNCVISGTITPAVGTVVTFTYTKGGVTTTLPRKLRVLSSFADPFRRTTTVELGCKLTYLQDLKDPVKWTGLDDPANTGLDEADAEIITIPIAASSAAAQCLSQLGITASSLPLTNTFSVAEFDFSAGYVEVLSNLLVSESYCGYLDSSEVLQVFSLDQVGGTGPVLDSSKIIDLGPIGVGQLPAEGVFVTYSSLKLKGAQEPGTLQSPSPLVTVVNPQDPLSATPSIYVKEGGNLRFDITLSAETSAEATYSFLITGTATANDDYDPSISWSDGVTESTPGQISVPEGVRAFSATITTRSDAVADDNESLSLTVGGVTGTGYILNVETEKPVETQEEVLGGWEKSSTSRRYDLPVSYTAGGVSAIKTFRILDAVETVTSYEPLRTIDGQTIRVVSKRITTETSGSAAIAGALVTEYLSNGIEFNNEPVSKVTTETFSYDGAGNETEYERTVQGSFGYIAGAAGVPFVFSQADYVNVDFQRKVLLEQERRETLTTGTLQRVVSYTYGPWARTITGQQSIAAARDSLTTGNEVEAYLEELYVTNGFSLLDVNVAVQTSGGPQRAPSREDLINAENVDQEESKASTDPEQEKKEAPDPTNNWRTESTSESEFAMGSPAAQRRIELSMPYAPDDSFYKYGVEPNVMYGSVASTAKAKAQQFGRVQNRLLLGNRSGMNVQVAPESLPAPPFSPVVVQANGLSALYRTNGTSYTMDANGIVASSDLLFWGAVGGTGTFWFPVAPGITTLPTTPGVVGGQMTVSTVVPPWNETVLVNGISKTKLQATSFAYALNLLREVTVASRTVLDAAYSLPAASIAAAAVIPAVRSGASVVIQSFSQTLAGAIPDVFSGASLSVPAADVAVAAFDIESAGQPSIIIMVPVANMAVDDLVPVVSGGSSIDVAMANIVALGIAPTISTPQTYRYYMLSGFASTSLASDTLDLGEIELYNDAVKHTGITCATSFAFSSGTASALVDGIITTSSRAYRQSWSTYRPTATITLDLGSAKLVTHVKVFSLFSQPRFPASFALSGSNNNVDFAQIATVNVGTSFTLVSSNVYSSALVAV